MLIAGVSFQELAVPTNAILWAVVLAEAVGQLHSFAIHNLMSNYIHATRLTM